MHFDEFEEAYVAAVDRGHFTRAAWLKKRFYAEERMKRPRVCKTCAATTRHYDRGDHWECCVCSDVVVKKTRRHLQSKARRDEEHLNDMMARQLARVGRSLEGHTERYRSRMRGLATQIESETEAFQHPYDRPEREGRTHLPSLDYYDGRSD